MSGAAAGWVFYTTFPAPDMARKRTLGKLTIEPVDVGGPKLTKPWVHCPMGIVPLAGVVRALWASGRDILGRCGTSVRGRFGPVSETRPLFGVAPRPRAAQGELPAPWLV